MPTSSKLTRRQDYERVNDVLFYARRVYCLEGLDDGLPDDQVLEIGRNPDEFGGEDRNKVPEANAPYEDLLDPRFRVSGSARFPGRYMVDVRHGRRYINTGPLTDVQGETAISQPVNITIPYTSVSILSIDGLPATVYELRDSPFIRGAVVQRLRSILPSGVSADDVTTAFLANFRKIYPGKGVLTNAYTREINQSQLYVFTEFTNYSKVRAFPANAIEAGASAVNELPLNGEYIRPNPNGPPASTQVRQPGDIYEPGGTLPWAI